MSWMISKNGNTWRSLKSLIITGENPHPNGFKNGSQHKKPVKMNENQSIISKKYHSIFRENVSTDFCGPDETAADTKDCLSDTTKEVSKLIRVKFRKSPGNINYSTFSPGWTKLYNIHWGGSKFKHFSAGNGFTG